MYKEGRDMKRDDEDGKYMFLLGYIMLYFVHIIRCGGKETTEYKIGEEWEGVNPLTAE